MRSEFWAVACTLLALAGCAGAPTEKPQPQQRAAQPSKPEQPQTVTSYGIVDEGGTRGEEIWFKLSRIDQRFVLDVGRTPELQAITDVLEDSSKTARSLLVTYDLAGAAFDIGQDEPSYVVRKIDYDGRTVAGTVGPRWKTMAPSRAEAALARGIAYYNGSLPERAIAELDDALKGDGSAPERRRLALKTRGLARMDAIAAKGGEITDDVDRTLIAALDDFRTWGALAPDDNDPRFKQAQALRDLGAYEEAIALYEAMPKDDPNDAYWIALRLGATYRTMGNYDKALAAVDALKSSGEVPEGMAWHYHRGWTLYELGRDREAVEEFTAGLEDQPDFTGAFIYRACANLRLGHLPAALDDRRQAQAIMAAYWKDQDIPPNSQEEIAIGERLIASLESAIASGKSGPIDVPCLSEDDSGDRRRERSRLLSN